MLKIVNVPNPILNTPVKQVVRFDSALSGLVTNMVRTLRAKKDPQGVGLAAPQVGVNKALFIIRPTSKGKTEVFINPKIIKHETLNMKQKKAKNIKSNPKSKTEVQKKPVKLEGCLSIPKIWGTVSRSSKVLLKFQDIKGKNHEKWFGGFKAVILQHEVDHLKGILFTQRALEQGNQLFEEKEGELEKVEIK